MLFTVKKIRTPIFVLSFLLSLAAWLSSCSTSQPSSAHSQNSSADTNAAAQVSDQDWGPVEEIDMSRVPDAVPKYEVRTIAGNKNPYDVLGKTYYLMQDERTYKERGIASWYGYKFNGEHTSNGEVYDMFSMTAAHKTLPIPSYVRVTNLNNQKSVVVRVNDRGPFFDNRIIDLSYAAAQRLGITRDGTGYVEVEVITPTDDPRPPLKSNKVAPVKMPEVTPPLAPVPPIKLVAANTAANNATTNTASNVTNNTTNNAASNTTNNSTSSTGVNATTTSSSVANNFTSPALDTNNKLPQGTYLQVGAFAVENSANQFASSLRNRISFPVIVSSFMAPQKLFRVRIGPFKDMQALQKARDELLKLNIVQMHTVYQ